MPLNRTYLNIFLNISLWVFFYMFIYVYIIMGIIMGIYIFWLYFFINDSSWVPIIKGQMKNLVLSLR